jgi:hypothetical protein
LGILFSLFPSVQSGDGSRPRFSIGDRVIVDGHLCVVLDRVCPHCLRNAMSSQTVAPPFASYLEVIDGDFKGLRWCPEHLWIHRSSGRVLRSKS